MAKKKKPNPVSGSRKTWTAPNGAKVKKVGMEFTAHDAEGRFLGWTPSEAEARYMAINGYPNHPDSEASDLSWWLLWNDAIDAGQRPLCCAAENAQFLFLGHDLVMSGRDGKHGWDINILDLATFWDAYKSEEYPNVLALPLAERPFRLE